MRNREISRILLAALFGSIAVVATAQTANPSSHDKSSADSQSRSPPPPTSGTGNTTTGNSNTAPANVVDDMPHNFNGKPAPADCNTDAALGEVSAACLRWLIIAHTF